MYTFQMRAQSKRLYIMQIDFSEFCRGQTVTAVKHALCAPYAYFSLWGVQVEL